MKKTLFLAVLLTSGVFAHTTTEPQWIVEAGTLVLRGQAAIDLYGSLNAKMKLDPRATKYHEIRIKSNAFAKCSAEFERGDVFNDFEITRSTCLITAPRGTTFKE